MGKTYSQALLGQGISILQLFPGHMLEGKGKGSVFCMGQYHLVTLTPGDTSELRGHEREEHHFPRLQRDGDFQGL